MGKNEKIEKEPGLYWWDEVCVVLQEEISKIADKLVETKDKMISDKLIHELVELKARQAYHGCWNDESVDIFEGMERKKISKKYNKKK